MRIAFLNPIGNLGGAEQSLLELLAELREVDFPYEPHLIVGTEGPLLEAAGRLGVTCHLLPMPPGLASIGDSSLARRGGTGLYALAGWLWRGGCAAPSALLYAGRVRALLTRLQPGLIHCNGLKFHVLSGLVRPANVPVIWYVHDFVGSRPLASRLLRWGSGAVRLVLANSHAVAADLRACLRRVPIQVLYYGIDVERFSPGPGKGAHMDELAGLPAAAPDVVRVGLVATYARWKGHQVLLDAAALLAGSDPHLPVRYYIIGGPIYHTAGSQYTSDELRAMIAARGLAASVGLTAFQQDPVGCYRALDVVVHASTKPEPFGRTIIEAMACGRSVIVAKAGGAAEIFTDGQDAVGATPGDPQALADAVRILARNPELRSSLARAARGSVVQRFSRLRMGQEARATYGDLVAESLRSSRGSP